MSQLLPHLLRKIFIDLDGVLVDFYGATAKLLGAPYKSLPSAVAWSTLEQVDHLFLHLPPLGDAQALWAGIQGKGLVQILTATPRPTGKLHTVPEDKVAWVREHINKEVPVIVVEGGGENKARWVEPGAILIDDLPRNIIAWEAAGGIGILHRNAVETLATLEERLAADSSLRR